MSKRISALVLIATLLAPLWTTPGFPAADSAPVVFKKSKYAQRDSAGKRQLVRSDVLLFDDRIEIRRHNQPEVLKALPYSGIREAQYSYSKSPRWKSGAGAAAAVGVFAIPLFFMKGKKHWLTLQEEGDYAVLKLDKKIFRELIVAFEARSGLQVERLKDE